MTLQGRSLNCEHSLSFYVSLPDVEARRIWAKKVGLEDWEKIKLEKGELDQKWQQEQGNCENMWEHLFVRWEIGRK